MLLGEAEPAFDPELPLEPLDSGLNESQRQAVRFALSARDVAVLHGPPGTGKTTTVVEVIRQAVRRGQRVLVCAASNLGVDNLLERLLRTGDRAVRLGHPARVLPELRAYTLDALVEEHPDVKLARKFAKEAFALFRKAGKWTRAKPEPGAQQICVRRRGRCSATLASWNTRRSSACSPPPPSSAPPSPAWTRTCSANSVSTWP